MPRLAVIGTLVHDTIWHPSSTGSDPTSQWGGIGYSLAAFSAACPRGWTIEPIVRVGADLADEAAEFLATLPGIAVGEGFRVVPEPNNRVELRYHDFAERTERLTGGVSSWRWAELEPLLHGVDAVYVNFISGHEVELRSAEALRSLEVPLYADLHSLFLRPADDREARRPARPAELSRWIAAFDVVQMNETEFRIAAGREIADEAALDTLAALGPAMILVTRGGSGAEYVIRTGADSPTSWVGFRSSSRSAARRGRRVPLATPAARGDPTGCGDVWGAVTFAGLLDGHGVESALRRANRAAAARIGVASIGALRDALAESLSPDPMPPAT